MADPRYRPGRRRKPVVAWILHWAAGVLFGILATLLSFLLVRVLVEPGLERLGALVTATFIAWPIGAVLGVWLAASPPPRSGRALGYALLVVVIGTAIVLLPFWLDVDADVLRGVSGIAALLLAPAFARLGVGLARA
ncbi:MAG TPA: hypothetical protein VK034_13775 [Enhygromyxa sp.]|nr:hypothetical protein [Enhygromyxa sp.]